MSSNLATPTNKFKDLRRTLKSLLSQHHFVLIPFDPYKHMTQVPSTLSQWNICQMIGNVGQANRTCCPYYYPRAKIVLSLMHPDDISLYGCRGAFFKPESIRFSHPHECSMMGTKKKSSSPVLPLPTYGGRNFTQNIRVLDRCRHLVFLAIGNIPHGTPQNFA